MILGVVLTTPSGVAQVVASNVALVTVSEAACFSSIPRAGLQVVIAAGSAISSATRATSAGLNGLLPSPPNTCFPSQMARNAPIRQTQKGIWGGRFKASSSPVRAALPSRTVSLTGFFASRHQSASAPTQKIIVASITNSARTPKNQIPARLAGTSARSTLYMIRRTLSVPVRCGETLSTRCDPVGSMISLLFSTSLMI